MKYIISENQIRNLQFEYLDYLFKDTYEVRSKHYPDSRFWKKDDEVVLELEKLGNLYVSYSIWTDISGMLPLNYDETQLLIKDWVEQHLGLQGLSPSSGNHLTQEKWRHI